MEFSFRKLLDRLNGFGFQPGDQLAAGNARDSGAPWPAHMATKSGLPA